MISFIVTTYNLDAWLLRRCLRSLVMQGFARDQYEIIVVDDESEVSPQDVVDEFAQQANVTLYVQKHNRQGAARNLGLRHAKGEWVQFVDGDDYLFAYTMLPVWQAAQEHELDLLMFGFREVSDEAPVRGDAPVSVVLSGPTTTGNEYMSGHNLFGSCCMQLFRRSLLDDPQWGAPLRFAEGVYVEDEEFATKLVWRARRMARVDVPVYAYYKRAGSTVRCHTRAHMDELFGNYFHVLRHLLDFEASLASQPHEGVTRKVRFLAVDILRRSLREACWQERWVQSTLQLRALGLYPLPRADYSYKYRAFRLLTQCGAGRHLLRMLKNRI